MMNANRLFATLFTVVFLLAILALVLVVPPVAPVHGQIGPGVAWDKQIWHNGELVSPEAITVEAGDTVEIVDRVWITNTASLTFALVESWTKSLSLAEYLAGSGDVVTMPGQLDWQVEPALPNTWHVLTRTFEVLPGAWLTDLITDTLEVELFGEEQQVLSLDYRAADFYLTKSAIPANQVPTEVVTYTLVWGNDGGLAPGVMIVDSLPDEVLFVDSSPVGSYNAVNHELSWGPFDLDTGDRMEATVRATIRPDVLPNVLITNVANLLYADLPPLVAQASHRSMAPCVEVETVAMTLLSLPPYYTGDALQIEADITPDDAGVPFRYQFVIDGVSGPTTGILDEPLSLELVIDTVGQHTVALRVWNCNLSIGQYVSDSLAVDIRAYLSYVPLIIRNQ